MPRVAALHELLPELVLTTSCSGSTAAYHCDVSHLQENISMSAHALQSEDQAHVSVCEQKGLSAYLCWADPTPPMLQAFDDLLLLKSGGLVTYHGSLGKNSCRLIEYFQVKPARLSRHSNNAAPSALDFMYVCLKDKASAAVVWLLLWLCHRRGSFVHADFVRAYKCLGRRASRACRRWRRA